MVQKVAREGREFKAGFRHPTIVNSFCQPSGKWVPFPNHGRLR